MSFARIAGPMRRLLPVLIFVAPIVLAQTSERYKITNRPAEEGAMAYLASSSGFTREAMSGVYLAKEYKSAHNGITHLIYRQRFQGIDVYNAAWVANIGPDNAIVSAG